MKRIDFIDIVVKELKKSFENLNDYQKKLLAYRKIIELSKINVALNERLDELKTNTKDTLNSEIEYVILAIIKASDFNIGYFESLTLYSMCTYDEDYKNIYNKSLLSFSKILENYKLLAQELKIDNPLELSHLFSYMLWNGYYSVSKHHVYKLKERLLLPSMNSFDVIKGKGVCLAYSELLHNYLTTCNKTSALLECKVPNGKNKIIRDYIPNINRNIEHSIISDLTSIPTTFILKGLINKVGNHAITLIKDNNKIFAYDPTNLYVLNVINKDTISVINGKGNFDIKPFATLLITPNSDPFCIFENLFTDNIEPAYTRNEIIESYERILYLIQNNLSILDDAYDNIHADLEVIDRQTDEIGGAIKALKKKKKKEEF